jgi:hypothetical protein
MTTPVVENFTPPPSDGPIGPSQTVGFDVVDTLGTFTDLLVLVYFPGTNLVEVPWDGSAFTPFYVAQSTKVPVTDSPNSGYRFALTRAGGWPAAPTFVIHAIDTSGHENP